MEMGRAVLLLVDVLLLRVMLEDVVGASVVEIGVVVGGMQFTRPVTVRSKLMALTLGCIVKVASVPEEVAVLVHRNVVLPPSPL
jgi:hypothetical protein